MASGVAGRRPGAGATALRAGVVTAAAAATVCGLSLTSPAAALEGPASASFPPRVDQVKVPFQPLVRIGRDLALEDLQSSSVLSALATMQTDATRAKLALTLPRSTIGIELVSRTHNVLDRKANGKPLGTWPSDFDLEPLAYFRSPSGAASPWGQLPPVRATTLAFGFLPAQVTLTFAQLREGVSASSPDGRLVPLQGSVYTKYTAPGRQEPLYDVTFSGSLSLSVSDLRVDGTPVDIGRGCTTSSPVSISLVGKPSDTPTPTAGTYSALNGGDLYGQVMIPSFAACRSAAGDDVSSILTSALSGGLTSIHVRQGAGGFGSVECVAMAPACQLVDALPQPTGAGQVPASPPDYAPRLPPPPLPLLKQADAALLR